MFFFFTIKKSFERILQTVLKSILINNIWIWIIKNSRKKKSDKKYSFCSRKKDRKRQITCVLYKKILRNIELQSVLINKSKNIKNCLYKLYFLFINN